MVAPASVSLAADDGYPLASLKPNTDLGKVPVTYGSLVFGVISGKAAVRRLGE
jgi:hypothetical protein